MSKTLSISVPEAGLEDKKSTTYVLCNRKRSTYQKQSYAGEKNPTTGVFLDSSKFAYLPLESSLNLADNEGRVDTMYIQNAPTIFKDDLYYDAKGDQYHTLMSASEEEAKAKGWRLIRGLISLKRIDTEEKLQKVRAAGKRLKIGFEAGIMTMDKFGNDANLKRFVRYHHQNIKAPNFVSLGNTLFHFAPLEEEKIAESEIGPIEIETQAMQYIASLRSAKDKSFSYNDQNKAKINATLVLLDMKNFTEDNYAQKHQAIAMFGKANPVLFMETIEDAFNERKMMVAAGLNENIKVIVYDKAQKSFTLITGESEKGATTKRAMVKTKADSYEDQVDELCIHLINSPTDWRDLTLLIEAAKSK